MEEKGPWDTVFNYNLLECGLGYGEGLRIELFLVESFYFNLGCMRNADLDELWLLHQD